MQRCLNCQTLSERINPLMNSSDRAFTRARLHTLTTGVRRRLMMQSRHGPSATQVFKLNSLVMSGVSVHRRPEISVSHGAQYQQETCAACSKSGAVRPIAQKSTWRIRLALPAASSGTVRDDTLLWFRSMETPSCMNASIRLHSAGEDTGMML
jgi:hypothetical protein